MVGHSLFLVPRTHPNDVCDDGSRIRFWRCSSFRFQNLALAGMKGSTNRLVPSSGSGSVPIYSVSAGKKAEFDLEAESPVSVVESVAGAKIAA